MAYHVDTTANLERTPEELLRITYSLSEVDSVVDGYPELDRRLYVPLHEFAETIAKRPGVLLGREVNVYTIPGGYDATNSSYRRQTLEHMRPDQLLFGEPDPDLPTGGDWKLPDNHPAVHRAITGRVRDFDQHNRPLVPGWQALLALRSPSGEALGMPTGIGWYTHLGSLPMCDAVTMRLNEARDDIEVLLYKRRGDAQSEPVWATPGGYVISADTQHPGTTPLQAASARRAADYTQRDLTPYRGIPLRVKHPISSGNTLNAGLRTTPYARFIHNPDYAADPSVTVESQAQLQQTAGYVSLRALAAANPTGGTSGKEQQPNPWPVWTTHYEYITAGLHAMGDPENQHMLGMRPGQYRDVVAVTNDLQAAYPMLDRG
jgi:hypothetical protein